MHAKDVSLDREGMRLAALYSLGLYSDDHDQVFDRFVHLAADIFHVPMATMSLIDASKQIFLAKVGLDHCEISRADTICQFTVARDETILIPDTTSDPRSQSNVFVQGAPWIRFYVGVPLRFSGQPVGTFCLLDRQPCHTFGDDDRRLLESFAFIAADLLELLQLRQRAV